MWETRNSALELLDGEFKSKALLLEEAFAVIDDCIDLFEDQSRTSDFHRVCGLALVKAKNLAVGAYSLILDGLGQEAGALLRPFIEYTELLTYFRLDPKRIQEAIDDQLPSAGQRAKLIRGFFQAFRSHLNEHASHSAYSFHAMGHLLEQPDMTFRKVQPASRTVLDRNMGDLLVQLVLLGVEAINSLQTMQPGIADRQEEKLESLKLAGFDVFNLDKKAP